MLLNLLFPRLLWDADDGAGSGGGQGPAPGTPNAAQGAGSTAGASPGDDSQTGEGDTAPPLVDVTATDEQGRKLWYSWEEHVKVHQEAASWRTKYQDLVKQTQSGTGDGGDGEAAPGQPANTSQLEQQLAAQNKRIDDLLIANAVMAEAAKATDTRGAFHNPQLAVKLADLSGVTIGDDGTVSGVAEAVDKLAEAYDYLWKTDKPPKTTRTTNPPRQETLTKDDIDKMTPDQINARWDEVQAVLASLK